ncbi:MSHA biogenesis protein MshA [Photobacterium angustum]|uniref:prepilin-type N-terminal cleavage/methylation domain-containing protein n=1 Tax=Photobacterium angustum TaxID=661 RepID=UPI0005DC38E0|nr:prepilin-type N-terminal cleavage/methylation domain-containing protein [Photobacterium angustum]KJG05327.1 MSHA biogenesis protein MshA [Photobacterium angustum]PSV90779.1 type II secretion system protein [Photobacterium angustum]
MKSQKGFTLIELVVVIVILGILAVTAAPKFMNLQTDARNASLEGLKGAIQGAAGITYGKAAVKGQEGENGSISEAGSTVTLKYGYPIASSASLALVVNGLSNTDEWKVKSTGTGTISYTFANQPDSKTDCFVTYTQATSTAAATVSVDKCS